MTIVIHCIYTVNTGDIQMTDSVVNFRVDSELKRAFEMAAKSVDQTSSQLLRAFMRETVESYMRTNAQGELLSPKKGVGDTKVSPKPKKQPQGAGSNLLGQLMQRGGHAGKNR